MKIFSVVIFTFTVSLQLLAGTSTGNGGYAYKIKNKFFVLDLVESNIHESPFFNSKTAIHPYMQTVATNLAKEIPGLNAKLLAMKLSEVSEKIISFGLSISSTIELYKWTVSEMALKPIELDDSVFQYNPHSLFQAAVRNERAIVINGPLWRRLDEANQVALILHEALYSLINVKGGTQSNLATRQTVGFIFSPSFAEESAKQFGRFIDTNYYFLNSTNNTMRFVEGSLQFGPQFRYNGFVIGDWTDAGLRVLAKSFSTSPKLDFLPECSARISFNVFEEYKDINGLLKTKSSWSSYEKQLDNQCQRVQWDQDSDRFEAAIFSALLSIRNLKNTFY